MRQTLRKRWLAVHRWLGLTVGLLFALIGLTGSVLVFDHAIDEWLNRRLLRSETGGRPAALETVIASAEAAYGDAALSLSKPRKPGGVYEVWFRDGSDHEPKFVQVLVDPFTAEVKGQRVWGEYLMTWIYRLHFRLLAGETGAVVVGLTGLVTLLSLVSGVYLCTTEKRSGWPVAGSFSPADSCRQFCT